MTNVCKMLEIEYKMRISTRARRKKIRNLLQWNFSLPNDTEGNSDIIDFPLYLMRQLVIFIEMLQISIAPFSELKRS